MEVGTGEKLGGMGGKIRQDLLGTTEAYNPEVTIATLCNKRVPACRRLLFPLLHAEKGRMRNAVANRGAASRAAKEIGDVCKQAINHDLNASKI